jgi:hypothetical protein
MVWKLRDFHRLRQDKHDLFLEEKMKIEDGNVAVLMRTDLDEMRFILGLN